MVCSFAAGKQTAEVVPAYAADDGYWLPNPVDGGWMLTHPKSHNNWVTKSTRSTPAARRSSLRLTKVWKYMRFLPNQFVLPGDADGDVRRRSGQLVAAIRDHDFLKYLQGTELASRMNDPTGLDSRFTACSSTSNYDDALSKLGSAAARAAKAKQYDINGKDAAVVEQLKLLLNQ